MRHGLTPVALRALVLVAGLEIVPAGATLAQGEDWVLPDDRLGVRTAPILLLTRPDVQADLGMTASQVTAARGIVAELYARAAALRGMPDSQALPARRAIDEAQQSWLETQLSDEQRARLLQVDLQWEGPSAVVSRSWVAELLGLTGDQRARLSEAVARRHAERSQGKQSPKDEVPLAQQVLSVLNPDQQQRWRALLGRPFTVRVAEARSSEARATR